VGGEQVPCQVVSTECKSMSLQPYLHGGLPVSGIVAWLSLALSVTVANKHSSSASQGFEQAWQDTAAHMREQGTCRLADRVTAVYIIRLQPSATVGRRQL
jgi:hypothetical protein